MNFIRHFLLAIQFFTRIPVTGRLADWVGYSAAMLRASAAHFPGVGIRLQNLVRLIYVEAHLFDCPQQGVRITGIESIGEVGLKQGMFQRPLLLELIIFKTSPMQHAMRIKSVVHTAALALTEDKTKFFATRADRFSSHLQLRWCCAVFLRQMLGNILSFRHHIRIQLERLKMNFRYHLARQFFQCLFERSEPNDTPRARNIRNKINTNWGHIWIPDSNKKLSWRHNYSLTTHRCPAVIAMRRSPSLQAAIRGYAQTENPTGRK